MSKISQFLNTSDQPGKEKITGQYGCKHCEEIMDFAWWDEQQNVLFWICPNTHRTEQKLV